MMKLKYSVHISFIEMSMYLRTDFSLYVCRCKILQQDLIHGVPGKTLAYIS